MIHLWLSFILVGLIAGQNPELIAQWSSKLQAAQLLETHLDFDEREEIVQDSKVLFSSLISLKNKPQEENRWGYKILRRAGVSEACITDLFDIPDNNASLLFLDVDAKIAPGFLSRVNLVWDGNYKGCLALDMPRLNRDAPLRGKYCWASRKLPALARLANPDGATNKTETHLNDLGENTCGAIDYSDISTFLFLKFAVCLPEKCSNYDATVLLRLAGGVKNLNFNTDALLNNSLICGVTCQERELHIGTDGWAITCLTVIALLVVLMILGTLLDVYSYRPTYIRLSEEKLDSEGIDKLSEDFYFENQHFLIKIFLAFSVRSNGAKIFDMTKRKGQIDCIHGIRFFSLTWVIAGHTYGNLMNNTDSWRLVSEFTRDFFDQVILNATFSVDTFFVMSGLLVSYLFLKHMQKCQGKVMKTPGFWFQYYFHRYLRLTPLMALMMWISASLAVYMANGPFWMQNGYDPMCAKNWWTNVLYVNNLVDTTHACYGLVWYLACDMQFYVFAPLLLVPMFWYPVVSVVLSLCLVGSSMAANAYLTVTKHYPPNLIVGVENFPADYNQQMYVAPWIRWCPYITGLMLGLIMHKIKKPPKIHWVVNLSIWLFTAATAFAVIFGLYPYAMGYDFPTWEKGLYSATCRFVWSLCIAWVIFACYYGYGGFINTFMSWSLWFPFSRLSYAAYLGHWILLFAFFGTVERATHFDSHLQVIGDSVAITMITFAAAIVLSLAIELPIITLEKIIFPHRGSGTRPQVVIPVANGGSIQTGSQSSSNTSGSVSTDLEYAVAREDDQSVAKY